MINKIINRFYEMINIAKKVHYVTIDMYIVAIKELQCMLYQVDKNDFVKSYNELEQALYTMKNHGLIFNFERIDKGFKIIPQNKIYINEDDSIVKFDID